MNVMFRDVCDHSIGLSIRLVSDEVSSGGNRLRKYYFLQEGSLVEKFFKGLKLLT